MIRRLLAALAFPWHFVAGFIDTPPLPWWLIQAEREAQEAKQAARAKK